MAKAMKEQDKKSYKERLKASQAGESSGFGTSDKSRYLAIVYDYENNKVPLIGERKRIYDEGKAKGW